MRELSGASSYKVGDSIIQDLEKRFAKISSSGDITAEALYSAAMLESLLEFINVNKKLAINTLRDGGIAAVVMKMKDANMISEDDYALLTRARRIRNRLAHRFHEFETSNERYKQEMLDSLKQACTLLKDLMLKSS